MLNKRETDNQDKLTGISNLLDKYEYELKRTSFTQTNFRYLAKKYCDNIELCLSEVGFHLQEQSNPVMSQILNKACVAYRNIVNKFQSLQFFDVDPEELKSKVTSYLNETMASLKQQDSTVLKKLNTNGNNISHLNTSQISQTQSFANKLPNIRQQSFNFDSKNIFGGAQCYEIEEESDFKKNQNRLATLTSEIQGYKGKSSHSYSTNMLPQLEEGVFLKKKQRYNPNLKMFSNKSTDTRDDQKDFISSFRIEKQEKEHELNELLKQAQQNLLTLDQILIQKNQVKNKEQSNAVDRLKDLAKQMNKNYQEAEYFIMEIIRAQGGQNDLDDFDFNSLQNELNIKFSLIQRSTASRVIKITTEKMNNQQQKQPVVKQSSQNQGKKKVTHKIESLENLLSIKNQEIEKKANELNDLHNKFEGQDQKLKDLFIEIDQYRSQLTELEQQKLKDAEQKRRYKVKNEFGVQVQFPDPMIDSIQSQLQVIMDENTIMKNEIEQNRNRAQKELVQIKLPSSFEETLLMIIQSDLGVNEMIIAITELLNLFKETDSNQLNLNKSPQDIYEQLRQQIQNTSQTSLQSDGKLKISSKRKDQSQYSSKYHSQREDEDQEDYSLSQDRNQSNKDIEIITKEDQRRKINKSRTKPQQKTQIHQKKEAVEEKSIEELVNEDKKIKQSQEVLKQETKKNNKGNIITTKVVQEKVKDKNGKVQERIIQIIEEEVKDEKTGKIIKKKQQKFIDVVKQAVELNDDLIEVVETIFDENGQKVEKIVKTTKVQAAQMVKEGKAKLNTQKSSEIVQVIEKFVNEKGEVEERVTLKKVSVDEAQKLLREGAATLHVQKIGEETIEVTEKYVDENGQVQEKKVIKSVTKEEAQNMIKQGLAKQIKQQKSINNQILEDNQFEEFQDNLNEQGQDLERNSSQKQRRTKEKQHRMKQNQSQHSEISNKEKVEINEQIIMKNQEKQQQISKLLEGKSQQEIEKLKKLQEMKKGATKVKLADGRTVWTKNPEDPESDLVEINEEEEKLLEGLEKIQKQYQQYDNKEIINTPQSEYEERQDLNEIVNYIQPQMNDKSTSASIEQQDQQNQTHFNLIKPLIYKFVNKIELTQEQKEKLVQQLKQAEKEFLDALGGDQNLNQEQHNPDEDFDQMFLVGDKNVEEQVPEAEPEEEREDYIFTFKSEKKMPKDKKKQPVYPSYDIIDLNNKKQLMAEGVIMKLYERITQRTNNEKVQELILQIKRSMKKRVHDIITYKEFKEFYISVLNDHVSCGESCIHLKRFFKRLGFQTLFYKKRKELKPKKQEVLPFKK